MSKKTFKPSEYCDCDCARDFRMGHNPLGCLKCLLHACCDDVDEIKHSLANLEEDLLGARKLIKGELSDAIYT